jgi:hypothetical protein
MSAHSSFAKCSTITVAEQFTKVSELLPTKLLEIKI